MKNFFKYAKPYWPYFIIGPLLMLLEVYVDLQIPALAADIINSGVKNADISVVGFDAIKMLMYVLIAISSGVGAAYCASKASVNFACDLRQDIFRKIQTFSFSNIDKFSTGSLVTRLTNDITQIQNIVNMSMRIMLRAPGMLIGALIMSFTINRRLAVIFLILVPILVGVIICIIRIAFPIFGKFQKKIDGLNSTVQEALTNVRVIKSFVREDFEEKRFAKSNLELKETGVEAYTVVILQMPIMTFIVNIATLAIVWIAGNGVMNQSMPIGDIAAFITYITQILMSLMMLSMIFINSARAMASIKRIREIVHTSVDIMDEASADLTRRVEEGGIEFKNVSFRYYKDNEEKVLKDISFKINRGETVGIIGSTGCGKTSLVQLIPRLYDADCGEVLVDGVNVKEYSIKNLREGVGMVLQQNVLFSGTIQENLLWGNDNASYEEVEANAKAAGATEFIESFPQKYETEINQGGVNLSGGQKQRLCIARALLKKPRILIMDDSTSAVDVATEARIRTSLKNELKEATKIIIAQRITSVIDADKIIVMDEGRIEAIGIHNELIKNSKAYQEIFESQMSKEGRA